MASEMPKVSLYDTYLGACRNELWADQQVLRRSGRAAEIAIYPARVSKLLPRIPSNRLLTAMGWILNLAWPLMAPFANLVQAVLWMVRSLRSPAPSRLPQNSRIWLYFSDAFSAVSPATMGQLRPDGVIMGPQHNATKEFGGTPTSSICARITLADITVAYFRSLRATWLVPRRLGIRHSTQSYTAFQWFATARVLDRLLRKARPTELVFLNHYDRWAVLFDHLVPEAAHILVQHGIVYRDIETPIRLANLAKAYVYSADAADSFRQNIVREGSDTVFVTQPASLIMTRMPGASVHIRSILLIGDPTQTSREVDLARKILSCDAGRIMLMVKPHPRFSAAPYMPLQQEGATLILDRDIFPEIDLAICGTSTLGEQYKAAGVEVIWYDQFTNAEIVDRVIR